MHLTFDLTRFFKYAEKEGYIEKNPCSNITLPKEKDIDVDAVIEKQKIPFRYFAPEEIEILRNEFVGNKKVWRKTLLKICEKNENFTYRVFHDLQHTFEVLPQSKEDSVNTLNSIFN